MIMLKSKTKEKRDFYIALYLQKNIILLVNWNVNLIVPINRISCSRKNTTYTVTAKKAGTTSFTISVKDEHGSKIYIWNDGEMPLNLNSTE